MPRHAVRDRILPDIPHLDVVVDPPRVDLVARFRQRDGRDGELTLEEEHGVLLARVPEANVAVVGGAGQHLRAAQGDSERVDGLAMPFVAADARACFEVPGGEGRVGGGGEEGARVAGPGKVEDGGFVAGEGAVVFALAVGAPEDWGGC